MSQRPPLVPPKKKAAAPVSDAAADAFIQGAPDGKGASQAKTSAKRPVTMNYPEDLLEQIDRTAAEMHMTRTTFVMQAVLNELKRVKS